MDVNKNDARAGKLPKPFKRRRVFNAPLHQVFMGWLKVDPDDTITLPESLPSEPSPDPAQPNDSELLHPSILPVCNLPAGDYVVDRYPLRSPETYGSAIGMVQKPR
jgi:hypothetical protein